jgi:hypothetical protein
MFVNDAGAHVGNFGAFGELVDNEGIELLVIGDGDVEQEVLATGDDEHADGVGEPRRPVAEGFDVAPRRRPDPDGDQGLDRAAHGGEIDVEQGPADDAALPQRPGPVQRRGGGDADRGGQIPVGPPCITLQFPQQRRIKCVQVSHITMISELNTAR